MANSAMDLQAAVIVVPRLNDGLSLNPSKLMSIFPPVEALATSGSLEASFGAWYQLAPVTAAFFD
jgi:hypothetical protein